MKDDLTLDETIDRVFEILQHLSESSGQHSFSVIFRSRFWGAIEFMLNWEMLQGRTRIQQYDRVTGESTTIAGNDPLV